MPPTQQDRATTPPSTYRTLQNRIRRAHAAHKVPRLPPLQPSFLPSQTPEDFGLLTRQPPSPDVSLDDDHTREPPGYDTSLSLSHPHHHHHHHPQHRSTHKNHIAPTNQSNPGPTPRQWRLEAHPLNNQLIKVPPKMKKACRKTPTRYSGE